MDAASPANPPLLWMTRKQAVIKGPDVRTFEDLQSIARIDATTGHDVEFLTIAGVHQHQPSVGSVK
jgi:hypothetical protein